MRAYLTTCLLLGVLLAPAACGAPRGAGSPDPGAVNTGRRAALARLSVQNGTAESLVIAYRAAAPVGPSVIVGTVAADSTGVLAPIPAGEPIILFAAREDGASVQLQVRSFPLDAEWLWVIPGDTRFEPVASP